MSMSVSKPMSKPDAAPARRIELFTGAGRRRAWTPEEKAAIVADSYAGGASVSEIARRRGLTPTQLFTWRREARKRGTQNCAPTPLFVPARWRAVSLSPGVAPVRHGVRLRWNWRSTASSCASRPVPTRRPSRR
ncbi:transposase [Methylocapsa palsarum]|uniref:transposase n=1 Tax=Methylocapsa palsarum TaxID=1612308 RepID=UPI000B83709C